MDNKEFDELIKSKIKDDVLTPEASIDDVLKKSIDIAQNQNRPKWFHSKALVASLAVIIVSGGILGITKGFISDKAIPKKLDVGKVEDSSKDIGSTKEEAIKKPIITVDIMKEKEKLAEEGYIVKRENIPTEDSDGAGIMADKAYSITLKDRVFGAVDTLKGEVLGVNYFVSDKTTLTKAKFLVKESYDNKFKPGDIITVYSHGGVITHYQFIINHGIDEKFNMSKEELEEAKKKMVVDGDYGSGLLYPEDNVVVFVDKVPSFYKVDEDGYYVGGKILKYKGENIIINNQKSICEDEEEFKELYSSDKLVDLESKIKKAVEEKVGFSKEKAKEAAYSALTEEEKKAVVNLEDSYVTYHSKGRYLNQEKSPEEIIMVTFRTSSEYPIMVVLKSGSYQVLQIQRNGI